VTSFVIFTGGNDVRRRSGIHKKKGKTDKICNEKTREENIVTEWKTIPKRAGDFEISEHWEILI
jgi:hypothetical protein